MMKMAAFQPPFEDILWWETLFSVCSIPFSVAIGATATELSMEDRFVLRKKIILKRKSVETLSTLVYAFYRD